MATFGKWSSSGRAVCGVAILGMTAAAGSVIGAGSVAAQTGSVKRFCTAAVAINVLFATQSPDEDASTAEIDRFERAMNRLLDRVEDNAPAEIADTVKAAVDGVRADPSLSDPAAAQAVTDLDNWVVENCGYEVVAVTATDYAFDGIPRTLPAGTVLFNFTNEGTELHEFVLMRVRNDKPLDELLAVAEEDFDANFEFISAVQGQPGDSAVLYAQLRKPGRYAAVCFLPVGSTSPEAVETATGPPHHAEGMVVEFQVKRPN